MFLTTLLMQMDFLHKRSKQMAADKVNLYVVNYILLPYVSIFEKRARFTQIDDFDLVYCFESTVNELHVTLFSLL